MAHSRLWTRALLKIRVRDAAVWLPVPFAGATNPEYFESLPYAEFERLMRINYLGVVGVTKVRMHGYMATAIARHAPDSQRTARLSFFVTQAAR
jgi:hypothetical protein